MGASHGQRRTLLLLFFLLSAVLLFDAVLLSYRDRLTFTPRAATVPEADQLASTLSQVGQLEQTLKAFVDQTAAQSSASATIRDKALEYEQAVAQLASITKNPHPDETVQTQRVNSALYQVNMGLDGLSNSVQVYGAGWLWDKTGGALINKGVEELNRQKGNIFNYFKDKGGNALKDVTNIPADEIRKFGQNFRGKIDKESEEFLKKERERLRNLTNPTKDDQEKQQAIDEILNQSQLENTLDDTITYPPEVLALIGFYTDLASGKLTNKDNEDLQTEETIRKWTEQAEKNLGKSVENLTEAEKSAETASKELDAVPLEKYDSMDDYVAALNKKAEEESEAITVEKEKTQAVQIATQVSAEVGKALKDAGNPCASPLSDEICYSSDIRPAIAGETTCTVRSEGKQKEGVCIAVSAKSTWGGIATFLHLREKPEFKEQIERLDESLQELLKKMPKFTQKCICELPPSPEPEKEEQTTSSSQPPRIPVPTLTCNKSTDSTGSGSERTCTRKNIGVYCMRDDQKDGVCKLVGDSRGINLCDCSLIPRQYSPSENWNGYVQWLKDKNLR